MASMIKLSKLRAIPAIATSLAFITMPCLAVAQLPLQLSQPKAANLARMRAESINGGLREYRAAQCMYVTGGEGCMISKTDDSFLFRFQGGAPGWQQLNPPEPTIETDVLVARDGSRILSVPYNGPLK
ncbi:MAG: Uncharacterised protein [Prochlorococcus marinus str. MIT 9215]|nr:MAG: Uncharacterised protein [Prochlorococcus marinus str. MIT 9215]